MAVEYDASTKNVAAADPQSFTHTPSGTPRGVVVMIAHGTTASDIVVGVTYGGVAMTRIGSISDALGEPGRAYSYFLGVGVPAGAQTVSVDRTEATTSVLVVAITVTGVDDMEAYGFGGIAGDLVNPRAIVGSSGNRISTGFLIVYSGLNALASLTAVDADTTIIQDNDFGIFVATCCRRTTAGEGTKTIGYTAGSDDVAQESVTIGEISTLAFPYKARRIVPLLRAEVGW